MQKYLTAILATTFILLYTERAPQEMNIENLILNTENSIPKNEEQETEEIDFEKRFRFYVILDSMGLEPGCRIVDYEIKKNETLYKILSEINNTYFGKIDLSLENICDQNPWIKNPDSIPAGKHLKMFLTPDYDGELILKDTEAEYIYAQLMEIQLSDF